MSKYAPLGVFLRAQKTDEVTLSFEKIENIVGDELPASQNTYAWWSNNPDNNVATKIWLEAGWRVKHIRLNQREIVFQRDQGSRGDSAGETNIAAVYGYKLAHYAPEPRPGEDPAAVIDPMIWAAIDAVNGPTP